jgi:hypothetical protein
MPITNSFFIMPPHLRCGNNIGLCFDGARAQEKLPVSFPGRDSEGRRVGEDLGVLTAEGEADFGEAELG